MDNPAVSLQPDGQIAVITIANPPVNTITAEVRAGLNSALDQLPGLRDMQAVLLRCEGSTFCSGADIAEFNGPPKEAEYRELFARFEALTIPVVAAMHGTVLGGGLELALACHYRIAVPEARFGFPEVTLGIIPGAGGTQRMPRLIGVEQTLELIIAAKPVSAAQALQLGFLDEVIEGELHTAALAAVRRLVLKGGVARPTSARAVDPATASAAIIERLTALARRLYPNREAALTAIKATEASVRLPLAQGLLYEEELANQSKNTV